MRIQQEQFKKEAKLEKYNLFDRIHSSPTNMMMAVNYSDSSAVKTMSYNAGSLI